MLQQIGNKVDVKGSLSSVASLVDGEKSRLELSKVMDKSHPEKYIYDSRANFRANNRCDT
jgi:hypothetical protein